MPTEDSRYIALLKKCLSASIYEESAWRIVEGPMPNEFRIARPLKFLTAVAKKRVVKFLKSRGFRLMRAIPFNPVLREQGFDWPCFGYSMIGTRRLDNIQHCVETVLKDKVPGDFIEAGVWRGGAVILMRALLEAHEVKDRIVWCADSFEGLPKPNAIDLAIDAGSDFSDREFLSVSLEAVQENFRRFGLLDQQVRFLKGWFSDTLPNAPVSQLSLIRLDGDLYESTMDALAGLYHRLSPGGFVIVDDYHSWPGCKRAVTEFREKNKIDDPIEDIDAHACFWRRRA